MLTAEAIESVLASCPDRHERIMAMESILLTIQHETLNSGVTRSDLLRRGSALDLLLERG